MCVVCLETYLLLLSLGLSSVPECKTTAVNETRCPAQRVKCMEAMLVCTGILTDWFSFK